MHVHRIQVKGNSSLNCSQTCHIHGPFYQRGGYHGKEISYSDFFQTLDYTNFLEIISVSSENMNETGEIAKKSTSQLQLKF